MVYVIQKTVVQEYLRIKVQYYWAKKFDLHQINSVQIWCKKVQTKLKSKAKMVNAAFAYKFTTPC